MAQSLKNVNQFTGNLAKNNEHVSKTLENLDKTASNLAAAKIPETLENLNSAITDLKGMVGKVNFLGLVYITRGGQNRQVWANSLVDGGMFAHSRNPLYVGNLLIILGLAIVHNGWAMYLVALPVFLFFYTAIVLAEEEYLHGRFGEAYTEYRRRVPRWLPSLRGLGHTISSGHFDWLKVLRKEYGTPFAWLSGFLLLLIWEHHSPSAILRSPLEAIDSSANRPVGYKSRYWRNGAARR